MSIQIDRVYNKDNVTQVNKTGISWTLWTGPITGAPAESGSGISTDAAGALTVPSVAVAGTFALRVDDNEMGLYKT